jgi:hypothetical protein
MTTIRPGSRVESMRNEVAVLPRTAVIVIVGAGMKNPVNVNVLRVVVITWLHIHAVRGSHPDITA